MAEIDHIKLLCRGVTAWNEARANADFLPDLSHVEIRDAVLRGADFRGAEFDGARCHTGDGDHASEDERWVGPARPPCVDRSGAGPQTASRSVRSSTSARSASRRV